MIRNRKERKAMSMNMIRKLPTPKEIKELYPLSDKIVETKKQRDKEIADVFTGKSNKFLLIIGPCSADKEEPVLDYISRLVPVQEQVKDKILIIPRIYTNKPRTTGEGYKGMIHQPDPTKKEDMLEGLIKVRSLHTKAIEQTGFTCADEMLYPENYRYLSDLLSYVAIGARSVEDQQHRLTSSGMDIPVGMKKPHGRRYVCYAQLYPCGTGKPHIHIQRLGNRHMRKSACARYTERCCKQARSDYPELSLRGSVTAVRAVLQEKSSEYGGHSGYKPLKFG